MSNTVDLPADLYQQALEIARNSASTVNDVIAKLVRDSLQRQTTAEQTITYNPETGFPQFIFGRTITESEIRSLEDED
jgi:hypothetical protein